VSGRTDHLVENEVGLLIAPGEQEDRPVGEAVGLVAIGLGLGLPDQVLRHTCPPLIQVPEAGFFCLIVFVEVGFAFGAAVRHGAGPAVWHIVEIDHSVYLGSL